MFFKSNNAAVCNRLDELYGLIGANNDAVSEAVADKLVRVLAPKAELEISEQFELAIPQLTREISSKIEKRLNDAIDGIKAQGTNHLGVLSSAIYKTHHVMLSKAKDIDMRLAVIEGAMLDTQSITRRNTHVLDDTLDQSNQNFEEMARQASIHDANNGDRMLTLVDRMRQLEHLVQHKNMLTHAKLASIFASLSAQINELRPKTREQYRTNPSVEWFIDNLDEIMKVSSIAELVRNNHIPSEKGVYEIVKAIRKLHPYSIENLKHEVASKIESWGTYQDIREAA